MLNLVLFCTKVEIYFDDNLEMQYKITTVQKLKRTDATIKSSINYK